MLNPNLICLGVPDISPYRKSTYIDALSLILEDVLTRKISNRAVINAALGNTLTPYDKRIPVVGDELFPAYQAIKALINAGVVIVASSGNYGDPKYGVSFLVNLPKSQDTSSSIPAGFEADGGKPCNLE